jgi:hypothetical protein
MKLDRNRRLWRGHPVGKYALLKVRALEKTRDEKDYLDPRVAEAVALLENLGILDWGEPHSPAEFFVIRLRDRYARRALLTYAGEAQFFDAEYAQEVKALADRAGTKSPFCKKPD